MWRLHQEGLEEDKEDPWAKCSSLSSLTLCFKKKKIIVHRLRPAANELSLQTQGEGVSAIYFFFLLKEAFSRERKLKE